MAIAVPPVCPQTPAAPTLAVQRSIGRCALWYGLSGGAWSLAWLHDTLRDLAAATGRDLHPTRMTWLFLVPLVNLWVLLVAWREVDAFDRERGGSGFSPGLYVALTLLPGGFLFTFPDVQSRLNAAWQRHTGGAVSEAPLGHLGSVMVGLGAVTLAIIVAGGLLLMLVGPWIALGVGLSQSTGGA